MLRTCSIRSLVFLVGVSLAAVGCSTDAQQGDAGGSLSLELVLADGVVINTVSWRITGGDMEPMSGEIDTSAPGSTASIEVYGLPPGDDYGVTLEATSVDREVNCKGSAAFAVATGVATEVMVMLNCKIPSGTGAVRVNGKVNICAQLYKVVVSPLQTSVGNDIDLSSMGEDVENDAIRYRWTGTGGTIADALAAATTYTCEEAGPQTITITVSDDDFEHCMDDWTVPVTCVDADLCDEVDCNDDNECTDDECDPTSGACTNAPVDDGAACDGGAGSCSSGECIPIDLCEEADCDDGNECTDDLCDPADGSCNNEAVDDGTACDDGAGACSSGVCVPVDLCEGVDCDDDNECTNDLCDPADASCSNEAVDDGTACDGGAGTCVEGTCEEIDFCEDVSCPSDSECVEDGTCDPDDGMCIDGANKPDGTPCIGGGSCDGAGNCKINTCAQVNKAVVSPFETSLGNEIDLMALGTDVDDDPVSYRWTGTGGSIDEPSAPSTTYTCMDVGDHSVTIAVSDDDFVNCVDELTVPVTCVSVTVP
jgi:hypothetical protein